MKTIWKFPLDPATSICQVPAGARFLSAQVQRGEICVWALVDPSASQEARRFRVIETGHSADDPLSEHFDFLGTVQMSGGALVFHVFVEAKP